MSQTDVFGINEDKLDRLILDISDAADRINSKFNLLNRLVEETSNYFVCDSGNRFRNAYSLTKENFSIVNKNIATITSDLVKAKSRLHKVDDDKSRFC